jgi:hypothetical protein
MLVGAEVRGTAVPSSVEYPMASAWATSPLHRAALMQACNRAQMKIWLVKIMRMQKVDLNK